ncbi:MAG: hypothetical protein JXB00_13015 [Bacteroidales bacterium]|nr:hypothetical protein [Bacteroidales bacterium]
MKNENQYRHYLEEAKDSIYDISPKEGVTEWICPSNIALVKYWGKKDNQVPYNPSVSITLKNAFTSLKLEYSKTSGIHPAPPEFYFEGKRNKPYESRVGGYLETVKPFFPFLNQLRIKIHSENSFPAATGIASSASSFGALALSITGIEYSFLGKSLDDRFYRKASFMARLGSGSACRSVYGGVVLWGYSEEVPGSSDEYAVSINDKANGIFKNYCDSILIITKEKKQVSSSDGHRLMNSNPYAVNRFAEARNNITNLLHAISSGDQSGFISIAEGEAMALHAMMMTGKPYYLLMKPQTVSAIEKIRQYRETTGHPVCFTLDAGANVHMLYPAHISRDVHKFIDSGLREFCIDGEVLHDITGDGPKKLV